MKSAYGNYNKVYYPPDDNLSLRIARKMQHPKYTNYTMNFKHTVDYIFHNDRYAYLMINLAYRLNLISLLEFPHEDLLNTNCACPNMYFPSDHLRIEALFEFDKKSN